MPTIRVAIAGLGAVGRTLASRLAEGIPGLELVCAAAGNREKAEAFLGLRGITCPVVDLADFPDLADLAVECAPPARLEQVCRPMLEAGRKVMVLSAGGLLLRPDLIELARGLGGQIIVPTGALLGLDAVTAAAEGSILSVKMTTRKPPMALVGAPYFEDKPIDLMTLREPLRVFTGTAREAAAGFPSNLNVVAALALAGIGPDRTIIDIWADPTVTRNCHSIDVDADAARMHMTIENVPSENPRTGRITALSVLAALRKVASPLRIGT